MKLAHFDCFSGASGDMLLGSLLDAGLDFDDLQADLARLSMGPYRLVADKTKRKGLTGTHLRVIPGSADWPARNLPSIAKIVEASDLPDGVKSRSMAVFRRIARAEAAIHGTTIDEVHFHEIGAVDTLVDVVGFVCALRRLQVEAVYSSPLTLGGGTIQTEHGRLPAPAPATLAILAEVGAPTVPGPAATELVTPTGAALLAEFARFERPALNLRSVGYGFGTKEFDWPNALRVWLGETPPSPPAPDQDEAILLACNLDDASGEVLGYTLDRLLQAGALDAWFTPIHMKKNRPATQLSVLARPEDAARLAALMLRETPTLGVRQLALSRTVAQREFSTVETPWGPVQIKLKFLQGRAVSASPEYDDCARLAQQAGVPLQAVIAAAQQAASPLLTSTSAQADLGEAGPHQA
jgi:pyridinium-3,5-bisthiocarboxylic acid mononucleotide nickel chelatase